ncbi:T9SS type A sorting domain-containing protein [Ferruginibacter albus]|uniref:T9SS type A sorting domain-containing protein n=1 Tax=Ferruginibacter albus TaxID=2875540 RepID=UPI001CC366A9|nr:T9SS type A sorting domain-containing protein [Ferruginibacter albus]UAY50732.1 T9SS type A sorting domain-containing protein [Ferruginibacter albus]
MRKCTLAFLLFTFQTSCLLVAANAANSTPIPTATLHIDLNLLYPDGTAYPADGTVAQFRSDFSAGVDYLDATKLTNLNENLGLLRNGKLLSIERRPTIQSNDTLFLNLTKTTQRSYQFTFTPTNFSPGTLQGYLKDAYTGKTVLFSLDTATSFNFTIDNTIASQDASRFTVIIIPLPSGAPVPVTYSSIEILQQNNNAVLQWQVENQLNIVNYSIERSGDGNNFSTVAIIPANNNNVQYKWTDGNTSSSQSFYRVRSTDVQGKIQYSKIVVINDIVRSAVDVYPNPVHDGIFFLELSNMPKGNYYLYLTNSNGQLIASKIIEHNAGSSSQAISINKNIAKGMYQLKVVGSNKSIKTFQLQFE